MGIENRVGENHQVEMVSNQRSNRSLINIGLTLLIQAFILQLDEKTTERLNLLKDQEIDQ